MRIGVVAIAATAALVQSPTDKREDVIQAIDRFQLQPGTALGSGIVIALGTLLPHSGLDVEQIVSGKLVGSAMIVLCTLKLVSWSISLGSGTSGGTLAQVGL